jgi:bud site selection protein 31
MPKLGRRKAPPSGYSDIEPTLLEFEKKLRQVENTPHDGKRIVECSWPIFQIHHQRSRYIYELYYERQAITKELYEYCLEDGLADRNLIAKWKKPGFERLCCLRCIQRSDTNFGTACICRVPRASLPEGGNVIECVHCGCRGCGG